MTDLELVGKNENEIIGKNLKALREKFGYSQEFVASHLGITRENISYYEGGREVPMVHLTKLADLLNVELSDLVSTELDNQVVAAFAFKKNELLAEDAEAIARFNRIVKNYIKMKSKIANGK